MNVISPHDQTYQIVINIKQQTLELFALSLNKIDSQTHLDNQSNADADTIERWDLVRTFAVSTAKNGVGNLEDTGCTPLGSHVIAKKIGQDNPINTVYVGRVPTGEIYDESLAATYSNRDWILTRILWLEGCKQGVNKGLNTDGVSCDTFKRYIYIHGTPQSEPMGIPLSHGCIRMHNEDIVWLFDKVEEGTAVNIIDT